MKFLIFERTGRSYPQEKVKMFLHNYFYINMNQGFFEINKGMRMLIWLGH
jgi:hypothetical protein